MSKHTFFQNLFISISTLILVSGFSLSNFEHKISNISNDPDQNSMTPTPTDHNQIENDDLCGFTEPDCVDPANSELKKVDYDLASAERAEVIIILFWMQDCAYCEKVLNSTLPEIDLAYSEQVFIYPIELKEIEDIDLFYSMAERLGVSKNNTGVPLMIIGNEVLTGNQISTRLTKRIDSYLQNPPYSFTAIPEFSDKLPEPILNRQANPNDMSNDQINRAKPGSRTLSLILTIGIPGLVFFLIIGFIIFRKYNKPRN